VEWGLVKEELIGDDEANAMLRREQREAYTIEV